MARINKVEIRHVRMTLKKKIKHASHDRATSDSIIVIVHLDSGQIGYGEGVPREYVTGESIESALACVKSWNLSEIAGSPKTYAELVNRLEAWTPATPVTDLRRIQANSARCAAEIAILDAFSRLFGVSIGDAVGLSSVAEKLNQGPPERVRYSGAITAETPFKEKISATKMRIWGFRQVKVKVGIEGQDDVARLKRIRRRLGSHCDMRLDANEAWTPSDFGTWSDALAFSHPSAYEQPVAHENVKQLGEPRFRTPYPVILDESLCGMVDAESAINGGFGEIFNLRLSKCGGLLPSLQLAAKAVESGRRYGLGCHPGESPILSAAGRAFASRVRDLVFLEGSYDRHVLAEHFGTPDITFGYGGRAKPLNGPGLGISIDTQKLDAMTISQEIVKNG